MKKYLFLIMLLLSLNVVSARIEVSVTQYDSVDQKAWIRLFNAGAIDYNDLAITIDGNERIYPGSVLKPGTAVIFPRNVAPAVRTVQVSTKEGFVYTETINFAKGSNQVQAEADRQTLINEQVKERTDEIRRVQFAATFQAPPKTEFNRLWIVLPIALIIIFLVFFFLKRKPKHPIKHHNLRMPKHPSHQTHQHFKPRMQPRSPVRRIIVPAHRFQKRQISPVKHVQTQTTQNKPTIFDHMPRTESQDIFSKLDSLRET